MAYVSPTLFKEPMGVVLGGMALVKIAKTEGAAGGVASISPASFFLLVRCGLQGCGLFLAPPLSQYIAVSAWGAWPNSPASY